MLLIMDFPNCCWRMLGAEYVGREVLTTARRFLYSFSWAVILSTFDRSWLFSLLVIADALSSSSTLVSRSFTCFSFRSRKARWAARFCALRFCDPDSAVSQPCSIYVDWLIALRTELGSDVRGLRPGFLGIFSPPSRRFAADSSSSSSSGWTLLSGESFPFVLGEDSVLLSSLAPSPMASVMLEASPKSRLESPASKE